MLPEKSNVKTALYIVGYLFIIFSVIPLIRNDNWVFRVFEYPRFQKLIIVLGILVAFLLQFDSSQTHDVVLVSMLSLNVCYLSYLVFPYTFIARNQMKKAGRKVEANGISLLICNVFQDNRNVSALLSQIEKCNPDLVLLVEVDFYWDDQLKPLHKKYPHRLLNPLDNTYGMSLYSKLELKDQEVKYLIEQDIPSIETLVKLRNGQYIKLFGLHPEPPVPNENPRSTERDAEILLVAKRVENLKMPVIVAGDLNDVAWSYTTELFLKVSGLLDPRRGRGFFNTFHAKYPMLRWPLDHVFCSNHFCLTDLKRLPKMGSDHYPIFISLALSMERAAEQSHEKLNKTSADEQMAEEKIQKV
ncbi:MAG TPA: endonuclease/exonuclease/phosphatase family protein [Chryseosolibacter sp.]